VPDLPQRFIENIASRKLVPKGARLLVAVSGGVDSMVLLQLLAHGAVERRWRLTVAHFNHQLRGRASDADELLVRDTSRAMGLPMVAGCGDVRAHARRQSLSTEQAARELRHAFLARVARQRGIRRIVLAHHADDQVELFFLRLFRGAAPSGLAGMRWRSPSSSDPSIELLRPLLNVRKADLLAYARAHELTFRRDATNEQLDFLRNRLRRRLLPLLRKLFQPALDLVVLRVMETLREESDMVEAFARTWMGRRKKPRFEALPVAAQRRVIEHELIRLGVAPHFDWIEALREVPPRPVSLSARLTVVRAATGRLRPVAAKASVFSIGRHSVSLGRGGSVRFDGVSITWEQLRPASVGRLLERRRGGREWFDADKVGRRIVLRHWRRGDRFQPIGMDRPVKLQDLFVNARIPRGERHRLVVATTARGVLFWVEGLRISDGFKLDSTTGRVLKWEWRR
jgi:tRNA(Ile)-lysidine synthase